MRIPKIEKYGLPQGVSPIELGELRVLRSGVNDFELQREVVDDLLVDRPPGAIAVEEAAIGRRVGRRERRDDRWVREPLRARELRVLLDQIRRHEPADLSERAE